MLFNRPTLSIVVIFFNMQREAKRTLYSLSKEYQRNAEDFSYEVIAIDNGSSQALDPSEVKSFGSEFSYHYFDTTSPSPVDAINYGASKARGEFIAFNIDGARLLSPGIFEAINTLKKTYSSPFIYTLGLHLGPDIQNRSMLEGYNQSVEDKLLEKSGWQHDGYNLFAISSLAGSSAEGYLGPITESNCFVLKKAQFLALGGMNPRFQTPGGGLVNLDFFKQACESDGVTPVLLLGEGTFHQFHGGVATNVREQEHPMEKFQAEYQAIYGERWQPSTQIQPVLFGKLHTLAKPFLSDKGSSI